MSEIIFKRSMNIGTISAESDQEFLNNCFIETPEYEEICDFENKKMILLGRTGSGKTALLNQIKNDVNKVIEVRPDTFALQYITNVPLVSKLLNEGVNLDIFFKFLWLHEIMAYIIKHVFIYDHKKIIEALSEKIKDRGRIGQLKKYLSEYDGIFFDEGCTEKITKEFEKEIDGALGDNILNVQGKLSEKLKKEIEIKASQYINNKQIKQLKNIITLFKEYFESNSQKKIAVIIDNLDENWIDDKTKYRLIDALLNAIRLFIDIPNIKILLAMRADLLEKTCQITNRQNEKDESFTLRLNWTKSMLKELLDKRIQYLFQYKYKKNTKITFENIFNTEINGIKVSDYIIDRTMMRPRDAINFTNLCIQAADNANSISGDNIIQAEKIFKQERFKALKHEWGGVFGNIDTYFKILPILGNCFNYQDLLNYEKYSAVEMILYENDYFTEKLVGIKNYDRVIYERIFKELLNIMYTIGFIGIKDDVTNQVEFSTPYHSTLSELDFAENLAFVVHPLFKIKE